MPNLLIVIGWYVFLGVVIFALQRMTRCFTQLNIFTLFALFLLMRHGVTVPFDDQVNPLRANIPLLTPTLPRFYLSLILMYLMLLAGVVVGHFVFGRASLDEKQFQAEMRPRRLPHGINPPVFLTVTFVCLALVLIQTWGTGIDLVSLFSGEISSEEYRAGRLAFSAANNPFVAPLTRVTGIIRFAFFPVLIGTLYFLRNYGRLWALLFYVVLGVGVAVGVLSGQKSPAVFLLLVVAVAFYMRRGQLKIFLSDWRLWGLAAILLLLVLPFLYSLQYPTMPYLNRVNLTVYRLTSEADRSLQLYFQVYPDIQPFTAGGSISLLNSLLGRNIPADMLPERFIPTFYLGPRYLNTWNAAFIGAAWADFGYLGVAVESLLVGILLQGYARWFSRARKTALVMGTQAALLIAVTRLSEATMTASFLTFGVLSSFLLYLAVRQYKIPPKLLEPVAPPRTNVTSAK